MHTGKTIAHYEVGEQLGQGGMGIVYRARDTKLDRTVALKFLPRQLVGDEEARSRFVQEAKAASALEHANICTIHDIAETDDGEMYIVMAYYEGDTLKYGLKNEAFPVERVTRIVRQIAKALQRAHAAGIVHRDIKPANVMVSDEDEVKLLDFGIAKLATGLDLTRTGSTLGTVAYMSPEQARGDEVTAATDVWSLGAVAYEMLTGRTPFGARSEPAMIYALLNEDPTRVTEHRADVPAGLAEVIHRALARDPADRYPTAGELLEALDKEGIDGAASRVPSDAGSQTALARPSDPRVLAGLAAVLVLVALGLGVMLPRFVGDGGANRPSGPAVASDVIAILPFTVRGAPELAYLGDGLVDLLSDKLDGAGSLQSLDPRSVIGTARSRGVDVTDPVAAADLAASLGAGRFVTGEVLGSGARLSISAALRDPGAPSAPLKTASVDGSPDDLFTLIDDLAASLLAGSLTGPGARLQAIATRTSSSIDATKEFLRGEQLHRAGRYRDASAAYNRAIELDSTFALAHYKKSYVNDYTDEPDDYAAADASYRFAGTLSERDQTLIHALREQRAGRHRAAEQIYRTHVLRYPDEVGALMQLGEILFHGNPRRGQPMDASREWFERVTDLEPGNIEANLHLARLDALAGRADDVLRRADFFHDVVPDSERSIEVEATYAFLTGDTLRQRGVLESLRDKPWYYHAYAATSAVQYARDPMAGFAVLEVAPPGVDFMEGMEIQLRILTGRRNQGLAMLRDDAPERTASWDTFEAFVHESGLVPPDSARVAYLLERLSGADPGELKMSAFVPLHDVITVAATEFERDWHVAHLLALLGRFDEAWEIQRRLGAGEAFPNLGSLRADAAASLKAELLYRSGDSRGALDVLRTLVYDLPGAGLWLSFSDGTRARFLRAELELELGDPAVAKPLYEGFHGSWSQFDRFYVAVAYERLGRIGEIQGDLDAAIFNYEKFVKAWQNADDDLAPLRDEVQGRLDALLARKAREGTA